MQLLFSYLYVDFDQSFETEISVIFQIAIETNNKVKLWSLLYVLHSYESIVHILIENL